MRKLLLLFICCLCLCGCGNTNQKTYECIFNNDDQGVYATDTLLVANDKIIEKKEKKVFNCFLSDLETSSCQLVQDSEKNCTKLDDNHCKVKLKDDQTAEEIITYGENAKYLTSTETIKYKNDYPNLEDTIKEYEDEKSYECKEAN